MTLPPPYHHGDARNALLAAAAELLERDGAAGLSLRQLAGHAGLSRQAPYNHFADKQALLAELVRDGFTRLGAALQQAALDAAPDAAALDAPVPTPNAPTSNAPAPDPRPEAAATLRLQRAGEAYIAFAQTAPSLFRLMFSRELVDLPRHPAAKAAAAAAFAELVAIVADLAPGAAADLSLVAWSLVHGYATLCIETGLEPPDRRPARAALFARVIAASA